MHTQRMKEDIVDLRDVFKILAKRKLVIILGTVLALVIGAILAFFILEKEYEAKVLLRVNNPSPSADTRNLANDFEGVVGTLSHLPRMSMETHVGQLRSEVLLQRVSDNLNQDIKNIYDTLNVTVVSGSNLISLKVRSSEPILVTNVANTISDQYIELISEISRQEIERSIGILQELQLLTKDELLTTLTNLNEVRANNNISPPESQTQIEYLESEVFHLQKTIDLLAERILETRVAGSINFGETSVIIVSGATVPKNPVNPNKALYLVVAFILGIFICTPLVFAIEHLDNRIWVGEDIERHTGLTVLGELPLTVDHSVWIFNYLNSKSHLAEAYRNLRMNLNYMNTENSYQTLLVTSPDSNDGNSIVATNLAIVLLKAGCKVLLVDCDLRKPLLHDYFGLDNSHGLVDVLQKKGNIEDYTFSAERGLIVLTSGPAPQNPDEIILSSEIKQFWNQQKKDFDYIIINAPPVLAVTDTVLLSAQVDGVILTLPAGTIKVNILQQAHAKLTKANARIIGTVLTRVKTPKSDYFYYDKSGIADKFTSWKKRRDMDVRNM